MPRIDKLPLAESDLIDIWIYGCKTWDAAQADDYFDSIEDTLNTLASSPKNTALEMLFVPLLESATTSAI
jgi:toxin ParE1/3/4